MLADPHDDRARADPRIGRLLGVIIEQASAGRVPAVHRILRRFDRRIVGLQVDLSVVDRRERAALIVVLSRIFFHF